MSPRTYAVERLREIFLLLGAILVAALATVGIILVAEEMASARGDFDYRPWILLTSLVGLNSITYLVWPNRWNIVAHTNLAFSAIAYAIPILLLDSLERLTSNALDVYYQVVATGICFAILGVLFGALIAKVVSVDRWVKRAAFEAAAVRARISRRVLLISFLSAAGVGAAFVLMGFVPAFAPDPLVAKFFRGAYAQAYAPVAPLYRAGTSALTVLLPVVFLYALKTRRPTVLVTAVAAVMMLLFGLLREPAVSGLLLVVGVYVAVRRRSWVGYVALLIATYFVGSSMYYLLAIAGFGSFDSVSGASSTLLEQVAAGAPDISDQVRFLGAWLIRPEYTHGLTWLGGLVPGNNPWNPSVWSLSVVNPGQAITDIASGGLRLPPPIWGLVSFSWPGVVGISFAYGLIHGILAGIFKRLLPSGSVEVSTYWLVIYLALADVLPNFFRLSYLSVLQLLLVVVIFFWRTGAPDTRRAARPLYRQKGAEVE